MERNIKIYCDKVSLLWYVLERERNTDENKSGNFEN